MRREEQMDGWSDACIMHGRLYFQGSTNKIEPSWLSRLSGIDELLEQDDEMLPKPKPQLLQCNGTNPDLEGFKREKNFSCEPMEDNNWIWGKSWKGEEIRRGDYYRYQIGIVLQT
ncbi:hypothetical protein X798_02660 [Onchocerca flexuosa]|uniref:Ovule protein n=2 Tax=Onchocerca flexuosa TaxID=387005 RepID=A0A183I4A7_9BILA|nr:hypothetical protein X798_02660 [Onchocerca flexuosa]VDP17666.1 unnamed protein product [Onchocerca flexuosa]